MKVVIASSDVSFVGGGVRQLNDWLTAELRLRGHQVERVILPSAGGYPDMVTEYLAWRMVDLTDVGDRLIAVRVPSYAVRHQDKVAWFLHHQRGAFDLFGTEHSNVWPTAAGEGWRGMLRSADDATLGECSHLFTNSKRVAGRLAHFNQLPSEVLYPPLWQPERYSCEGFDDTVVYPSRVVTHKRQHLLVQALAHTETPVRVRLLGTGPELYARQLVALAEQAGVRNRLVIDDAWVSEVDKQRVIQNALAVAYLPMDEDSYGYASLEAAACQKPVLTTTDSGGVPELVQHRVNGLVVRPHPVALAAALDELYAARERTIAMGRANARRVEELGISWDHVVERLLAPRRPDVRDSDDASSALAGGAR